jgi:hypothetical protein
MSKKTSTDRAIESLEAKKAVIQLAIDELRSAQASKPARTKKSKPVAVPERSAS